MGRQFIRGMVVVYASWLGMMLVHELGHVLHAVVSGGRVTSVSIPLLGFSQTIVDPNPRELFVVWGGPLWGVVIPLLIGGTWRVARGRVPAVVQFFMGFCLIANGTYIGAGWMVRAGDARDMMRLGTPTWVMILFGAACVNGGLWCWHRMGAPAVHVQRS